MLFGERITAARTHFYGVVVCDCLLFGPSKLFGTLRAEGYTCSGNISAWTRCTYVTKEPKRTVWMIPEDIKSDNAFL